MELDQLQKRWDEWGRRDPFWVILSDPKKVEGRWDSDEFFATGEREIALLLQTISELGQELRRGRALDFGCGVGRLTQALCAYFDECVGVDIAPSMIESARGYNRFGDKCTYLVNSTNDLRRFESNHFDLIYCNLVLQHMLPEYSRSYIAEFIRVLAPGGLLVFQIPGELVAERGTGRRLAVHRELTRWLRNRRSSASALETAPNTKMYGVPRDEVLGLVHECGGQMVSTQDDYAAGEEWRSYRYFVRKTDAA